MTTTNSGPFDPASMTASLEEIQQLLMKGAGAEALDKLRSVVTELKRDGDNADHADSVEPWRLIAAHLKAAEVEIEQTHLAPAADSVSKAIYVATHESQVAIEAPDPQLNV